MNHKEFKEFLQYVDKKITPPMKNLLSSGVSKVNHELVQYQVLTGGKRLRPALAVASCLMLGGKIKDIVYPAASIEVLHNFTLIIDDIVDHSILRRKKPTCWYKFGKSIAQVASIDYGAAVFQEARRWKKSGELCFVLAAAMKTIVDGEILDILFEQTERRDEPFIKKNRYRKIKEKDYLDMISKKTASLIETSCVVGGMVAGAGNSQLKYLREYGFNLGIAFQIRDDVLDIFGKQNVFGKEIGKDIKERKIGNIVILLALTELSSSDRKRFLSILKKGNITRYDIKNAISFVLKTKSREKACEMAGKYIKKAKENLAKLPNNKWNGVLKYITDFVDKREK